MIEVLTNILIFGLLCCGNGCLIFFLWWIIGQPQPASEHSAQFVQGRIFSSIGRRLCDWYEKASAKEELRILGILEQRKYDNKEERAQAYYEIARNHRRPNPAKAFGVCPICMGTYIVTIINTIALGIIGYQYGYILALSIS